MLLSSPCSATWTRPDMLGYLDTTNHVLEIGNTIIKSKATKSSPHTVVPSIKVLALKVRFGAPEEVRTLLSFLRCFPEVKTLHVMASVARVKSRPGTSSIPHSGKGSVRSTACSRMTRSWCSISLVGAQIRLNS